MKTDGNRKYIKSGITTLIVLSLAIVLTFILLRIDAVKISIRNFENTLRPFLYGVSIAYILAPMCGKIQELLERIFGNKRKSLTGGLSILLSLLAFILIIALLFVIVLPQVIKSVIVLVNALPEQITNLNAKIDELVSINPELQKTWDGITAEIISRIQTFRDTGIMPLAQQVLSGTAVYVSEFLRVISNLMLAIVISVYLLATRKRFAAQARLLLRSIFNTNWADQIEAEVLYADEMFHGFFVGKLIDSTIIGILCFIGCVLMGFSSAPLIAVVVGVTNIIPFFGPFIGAIPCTLLLLLENPIHSVMFLIFIVVLQQIDGNVIGPRILGNTTGLSGVWVTFAIVLFGGMWGITGMVVGVPLFAVIYDVIRKLCFRGLKYRGREDLLDAYNRKYHSPFLEKNGQTKYRAQP